MLLISRTRTDFGDRAFSAAGLRVWYYLPMDLGQPDFSLFLTVAENVYI